MQDHHTTNETWSQIIPFRRRESRFEWPDDFPPAFQDAVNDLGSRDALGQAVPRVLFEWDRPDGTTARLLWMPVDEYLARYGDGGSA